MKSVASIDQPLLTRRAPVAVLAAAESRVAAFVSLTKPRLVFLVLVTVAVGFLLGARGTMVPTTTLAATLGRRSSVRLWSQAVPARSINGWSGLATHACVVRPIGPCRADD